LTMADEKKQTEKKDPARGSWVVLDDQDQVQVVESSALKALWAAQPLRARVVFWAFGASRADVLKASV
jgi:hypothetical protein